MRIWPRLIRGLFLQFLTAKTGNEFHTGSAILIAPFINNYKSPQLFLALIPVFFASHSYNLTTRVIPEPARL